MLNFSFYLRPNESYPPPGSTDGSFGFPGKFTQTGLYFFMVGDRYTIYFNFLEGIISLVTANKVTENEVGGSREIQILWSWSNDGTTWSADFTYDSPTLVAESAAWSADNPMFFRVKLERTGDPGDLGIISIKNLWVGTKVERVAIRGRGVRPTRPVRTPVGFSGDSIIQHDGQPWFLHDFQKMMTSVLVEVGTYGGLYNTPYNRSRVEVLYSHPDGCKPDNTTFMLYFWDVSPKHNKRNTSNNEVTVTFRVGVKRDCGLPQLEAMYFDAIKNRITTWFGPNWKRNRYDIIDTGSIGIKFFGSGLYHAGIRSSRTYGSAEREHGDCGCMNWETVVEMKMVYPRMVGINDF